MSTSKSIAKRVDECMVHCLNGTAEGGVVVKGVVHTFVFNAERIAEKRGEIAALLGLMPSEFHKSGGGGWSFLNLCVDKGGEQWGEHFNVESLCCLGIAAGLASWLMPREVWPALPGGVPYVQFDTSTSVPLG